MLKNAFRHRTVDKTYHALVQGHPDPLRGTDRRPDRPAPQARLQVRGDGRRQAQRHPLRDPRGAPVRQPARGAPRDRPDPPDPGAHGGAEAPLRRGPRPTAPTRRSPQRRRARPAVAARGPARLRAPRARGSTSSTSRTTPTTSSTPWTSCAMPSEDRPDRRRGPGAPPGDRRRRRRARRRCSSTRARRRTRRSALPVHPARGRPALARRPGWSPARARRREVWLAEGVDGRPVALLLARGRLGPLAVRRPGARPATGSAPPLLDLAKSLRPDGLRAVGLRDQRRRPRGSTGGTGFVELRAHRRQRQRGAAARTSRWPGPTRSRSHGLRAAASTRSTTGSPALLGERAAAHRRASSSSRRCPATPAATPSGRAEIVARMARLAPDLGEDRLRRIMHEVISESLDAAAGPAGPGTGIAHRPTGVGTPDNPGGGTLKVEIWSDVVCPWCYIGKRRFEAALARFEHAGDVDVRVAQLRARPDDGLRGRPRGGPRPRRADRGEVRHAAATRRGRRSPR